MLRIIWFGPTKVEPSCIEKGRHLHEAVTMAGTPFGLWGEPVLVPGSMGSSSFVLAGNGNNEALKSASHGAGRAAGEGRRPVPHIANSSSFSTSFT